LLVHAVHALAQARLVEHVIVAAPPDEVARVSAMLALDELGAEISVVAGGAERQQSVALALAALPDSVDVVLVHDAARPLAPSELADAVAHAVQDGADAVIPALPLTDTVKRVESGPGHLETVVETIERSPLRAIQTPQGFRRGVLAQAHAAAAKDGILATDDAGLVERLGIKVVVVPGSEEALKVTRPMDLVHAEAILALRRADGVH
jgi:2-C-methyl-D-erythritol 4-phosphate cytidylyltransferase